MKYVRVRDETGLTEYAIPETEEEKRPSPAVENPIETLAKIIGMAVIIWGIVAGVLLMMFAPFYIMEYLAAEGVPSLIGYYLGWAGVTAVAWIGSELWGVYARGR